MALLGEISLTVTREAPGSFVGGSWVDGGGGPSTFTLVASVQPITPELMEDLPGGDRTSARFVLYAQESQPALITVDIGEARRPDRVAYRGRNYITQSIGDWTAHQTGIPSYEYVMLQVGDDEPGA